jgi:hypothetical protein
VCSDTLFIVRHAIHNGSSFASGHYSKKCARRGLSQFGGLVGVRAQPI